MDEIVSAPLFKYLESKCEFRSKPATDSGGKPASESGMKPASGYGIQTGHF